MTYKNIKPIFLFAGLGLLAALSFSGCTTVKKAFSSPSSTASSAIHLTKISYSSTAKGTVVKIFSNRKFGYTSYKLSDPLRLAVEIPEVALDFEPKRINVDEKSISYISVVRFPKVKSIRVEMELTADVPYSINQKVGHLEVFLAGISSGKVAGRNAGSGSVKSSKNENQEIAMLNEKIEILTRENESLNQQNKALNEQLGESKKELSESGSMAQSLEDRITFMEKKLSKINLARTETSIAPSISVNAELPSPTSVAVAAVPVSAPPVDNGSALREMVGDWMASWNRKDIDSFARFYSQGFDSTGINLESWIEDKRAKFERQGNIEITAEGLEVKIDDSLATAVFTQTFKSKSYEDRGLKTLSLAKESGRWKIVDETWEPL